MHTHHTVSSLFLSWRGLFPKAPAMHLSFLLPYLVLWFIWRERNNAKHENIPFSSAHIIAQVTSHLRLLVASGKLVPAHWRGCKPQVDFMPVASGPHRLLRSSLVRWVPCEPSWIKLNMDGAFDTDLQSAAGGGLIRSHSGNLLQAFSSPISASSSFDAELQALLQGLQLATRFNSPVWIEVDAASVVTLLNSPRFGPAQTRHTIAAIRLLLRDMTYRITHIPREGNKAADRLVAQGLHSSTWRTCSRANIPRQIAGYIRIDQLGLPSFRLRYVDI